MSAPPHVPSVSGPRVGYWSYRGKIYLVHCDACGYFAVVKHKGAAQRVALQHQIDPVGTMEMVNPEDYRHGN